MLSSIVPRLPPSYMLGARGHIIQQCNIITSTTTSHTRDEFDHASPSYLLHVPHFFVHWGGGRGGGGRGGREGGRRKGGEGGRRKGGEGGREEEGGRGRGKGGGGGGEGEGEEEGEGEGEGEEKGGGRGILVTKWLCS